MVPILGLWMPIVVAAVLVFLVSSIIHMALTYHRADYKRIPDEEGTLEGLRKANLSPGLYFFPYCTSPKDMGAPEMQERYKRGPVGMYIAMPSGPPTMTKSLVLWFVYCLIVGVFTAYLAGLVLGPGTDYLRVFRITGTAAFMAYGVGAFVDSIWKGYPWGNTCRAMIDGLIFALITAGTFGWLWPKG
ncbi:MAG TPA: hypothetical protein VF017_21880 [Thermoanaerobaculia bacterium]|nr:hypothetical protein [Thermoanaerobaculia bacterium]